MKRLFAPLIIFSVLLTGCLQDEVLQTYTFFRPVYKTSEQARAEIRSYPAEDIRQPGKIYYKDGYVFLNDLHRGIHVIDIRNTAQPKRVSFIKIPGCVDMAVRNSILYADMFTDLVAIDISDPLNIRRTHIAEGAFPENYYNGYLPPKGQVITDWVRVDTTILQKDYADWFGTMKDANVLFSMASLKTTAGNGTGGSMARFTLAADRLYTVSQSSLNIFNVSVAEKPSMVSKAHIGWDIETIFPYKQNLFIGSMTGMYIFDITNKDLPIQKGRFDHARVCDPVVADDQFAFVTLRNGNECQGFINQLDVVDVTNVTKPSLVKSYPMTNPHGLSKDGNLLLICDGKDGLRILDAQNPRDIKPVSILKGMNTYDVITLGGIAIVTATDGLYLIDYRNPASPVISSTIRINL
jgi:hypothetical protein